MKVIDLLNKIANGEEVPKIIKYDETIYYFRNYDYKEYNIEKSYCDEQTSWIEDKFDFYKINDEVEIIEEDKKIRKLDFIEENTFSKRQNGMTSEDRRLLDSNFIEIGNKLNEIIDKINEME